MLINLRNLVQIGADPKLQESRLNIVVLVW